MPLQDTETPGSGLHELGNTEEITDQFEAQLEEDRAHDSSSSNAGSEDGPAAADAQDTPFIDGHEGEEEDDEEAAPEDLEDFDREVESWLVRPLPTRHPRDETLEKLLQALIQRHNHGRLLAQEALAFCHPDLAAFAWHHSCSKVVKVFQR